MDYNGDGALDLIAGSYDGLLYLSQGGAGGSMANLLGGLNEWTRITDQDDNPVRLGIYHIDRFRRTRPVPFAREFARMREHQLAKSEAVTCIDWDQDGDRDLLMGADSGLFYLRRNLGTPHQPSYASQNELIYSTDGEPLATGSEHAAPVFGDLDGDGLLDLVSGCADGTVVWFRNVTPQDSSAATTGEQAFAPAEVLVQEVSKMSPIILINTCVELYDYNNDGKLDLIVGGHSGLVWIYYQQ